MDGPKGANRIDIFSSKYFLGEQVGKGAFSIVKKAHNTKGEVFAIKVIELNKFDSDTKSRLYQEVEIMKGLSNEYIINLFEFFYENGKLLLVLEFFDGVELFEWITNSDYSYDECDAATIIRQCLEGVSYLHRNGVAHRDLKPENVLYHSVRKVVKIIDFGLSKQFTKSPYGSRSRLVSSVGTPEYSAPEVFAGVEYDNSVDIWSLGVICYVLLSGFTPFEGDNRAQVMMNIKNYNYNFVGEEWEDISEDAKDFIQSILVQPTKRPTTLDLLDSSWITIKAPKSRGRRSQSRQLVNERISGKLRDSRSSMKISITSADDKISSPRRERSKGRGDNS